MKKLIVIMLYLITLVSVNAQQPNGIRLFAGTFTSEGAEGIYLCRFNEDTGQIVLEKVFKGIDNPNFLTISPDRQFLFTVTRPDAVVEPSGGYVQAYRIAKNGDLEFINKQVSHGADPCHIDITADGRMVAIATYGGGSVTVFPVAQDGILGERGITIHGSGSGPNSSRQKEPHAHSVLFSPDGKQLFSADLGTDKISIFDVQEGKIRSAGQSYLHLEPGAGPRHLALHPDGKTLYVINELNSTITSFRKGSRKWKKLQTITTLPEGFNGENFCADIHISADGRYLYGSNRGHNSIAVFRINDRTSKLSMITTVDTEGNWPRNFTLSPDGRYLLSANQRSGNIAVFRIDPQTGIPEYTGNELKIPSPVCLVFSE